MPFSHPTGDQRGPDGLSILHHHDNKRPAVENPGWLSDVSLFRLAAAVQRTFCCALQLSCGAHDLVLPPVPWRLRDKLRVPDRTELGIEPGFEFTHV